MYCAYCGTENKAGAIYCRKCGKKLSVINEGEKIKKTNKMSVFDIYISTFNKYAVFSGRATRKEYWVFILGNVLIGLVLGFLEGLLGIWQDIDQSVLETIFNYVVLIPGIAVGVRRMHDVDKSGWYLLVPFYNLYLTLIKGSKGKNAYGEEAHY